MKAHQANLIIAGGGIVGLATAWMALQNNPEWTVIVLEKEQQLGSHQSGRNSGVIHSGIYYKPGSVKATHCRHGRELLLRFCEHHEVPFEICGKVIVAVDDNDIPQLHEIHQRGRQNQIDCRLIGQSELGEIEPYTAGVKAILVPSAGIIDYGQVVLALAKQIQAERGKIVLNTQVKGVKTQGKQVIIDTSAGEYSGSFFINCTGVHSDRIARASKEVFSQQMVPFRGEYYTLKKQAHSLCNHLIYPVPNPNFPFLGVHFTRMMSGERECGPNAVLAFAREGYRKTDFNIIDTLQTLAYPGFQKLAAKHFRMGMAEMWRSISKKAFVSALQKLVPSITSDDLIPGRAGIRAQLLRTDGVLEDDFVILRRENMIHVCNAPSPAATSSFKIAETILSHLKEQHDV